MQSLIMLSEKCISLDMNEEKYNPNSQEVDEECECDGECWNCLYEDECNQDE